jgi:hypothetical protein
MTFVVGPGQARDILSLAAAELAKLGEVRGRSLRRFIVTRAPR